MKTKTVKWVSGFQVLQLFVWMSAALAADLPPCLDREQPLLIDNARVVELKKTAPLGKSLRARVEGRVTRVFPDKVNSQGTSHAHFEISIGEGPQDVLEVVYSEDFGDMPTPSVGAIVESCGDFINAFAKNNGFPPSPSGAIIHWVHRSNSPKHNSGYVVLDQVLYGFGADKRPRN